jgi:signal transduction histidine kinase
MSLLTVIGAEQLQEQWTEHAAAMTSHSIPDRDDLLPGEIERYYINKMYGFDLASNAYLNLPLYKDPTSRRVSYSQPYFSHETAAVFLENGEPIITSGEYMTFEYLHADSWLKGKEAPDGYGYISLEDLSDTSIAWGISHFSDVYRLTGYFEGNRFRLDQLAGFTVEYPVLYDGKTLAQWDRERGLSWEIYYENPKPSNRDTVCIYTTLLEKDLSRQILPVQNEPSSRLQVSLEEALLDSWPQRYESRSLWETVIIREGNYVSHDGTRYQAYGAIRCYPLPAAIMRLLPMYAVTEALCILVVVLYYFFLNRRIRLPLQQIIHRGEQNMLPLNFPCHPKWKEPYLLEEIYISAQQELQTLRQENHQLKTALDYAEHAEISRRQLVSNITHELKTPLAVIHSYCEGLMSGIAPEKQQRYLQIIIEEAQRMDTLVLEMLDLSRLEAGKVRLAQDQMELLELVKEILDKLHPLLEVKELTVSFGIADACSLTADEGRLRQVITNLVSNAIKYSPEKGHIMICVFQRNGFTHFLIENESPPLSEVALEKVWESFYRSEQSRTSNGTGLGLSICKAIIELHQGTCRAKNTSTGVEFGFSLPG